MSGRRDGSAPWRPEPRLTRCRRGRAWRPRRRARWRASSGSSHLLPASLDSRYATPPPRGRPLFLPGAREAPNPGAVGASHLHTSGSRAVPKPMQPAVTGYLVVQSVHIMAVVAAYGLPMAYPLLIPYLRRKHPRSLPGVHDVQHRLNIRLTGPGTVALFAFGAYMASTDDLWGETWVAVP